MPQQTVPVFVSSTWLDLEPERKAVEAVIHRTRETQFVGMEYFGSRDETTRRASLDEVDRSELYVGVFAARYGSGITEDEYRRARARGLPCLIYFKSDAVALTPEQKETDTDKSSRLATLKQELRGAHTVKQFNSPDDLAAQFATDLHRWLFDNYLPSKLRGALDGRVPRGEAQALLGAVKDLTALSRDLLARLKGEGFSVSIEGDFVGRDKVTNVFNVPIPTISALHQLPPPPRDFTGRKEELEELMSQIERGGVTISGLQGQGGIGKTALALKLAQKLAPRYPDAQFYLDLKGAAKQKPLSPAEALSHVIRAYHPTAKLPEGVEELRALYFSVLNGQRALVLMDNARDAEQVEPLVPPESCVLLVTSRQHFTLPGLFPKSLDTLTPEESRELLLKIAPRIGDRADEIAKLCGHLPLALRLAASALAERANLSPADYLRRLSDAKTRLSLVEASLTLSYELLTPDQQRLWRSLAVFPATFDAAAAAAVWESDFDASQEALGDLINYSLLEWDADTSRYHLHDLARLFADSRMSDDEGRATRMRHAAQYLKVLGESQELYSKGGEATKSGIALFDAEWGNIEAGQNWSCGHASGDDKAAWHCNQYPNAGAYILSLRQRPRDQILWLKAALEAARQLNDRATEGGHLVNLGLAYANLGETHRAIEFHEEALSILREIGHRLGEGRVLGSLALDYAALGEPRRAIEFHEQYLDIAREIGDRYGEGQALNNLGLAYADLGEIRRAIEFFEQSLEISREVGDRRGEGQILGNLGGAYYRLGDTQRAIEFGEQDLVIAREIGDHRGEASVLFNIGVALLSLGNQVQAIAHAEAALEIFEQIESPNAGIIRAALARWRGEATEGE
jgi:tetratricopeptide (TPR) repeat protein